ncbi:hypothetical protein [Achromobacter xylosoxidans]|uniref:hypothetical protein n=1 Tax=Alcaligenes xylosoxydans xylosoxydans TaxID=85698 RepID=UPI001178182D|nr:hypothetical protein [Achromobacter xylosoxidans]
MSIQIIDDTITKIEATFQQLVLGSSYLLLGEKSLAYLPKETTATVNLGDGVTAQPYYLKELQAHASTVMQGLLELCQTKLIAMWSDLLSDLHKGFAEDHFAGKASHPFGKVKLDIDISNAGNLAETARDQLCKDFDFRPYNERIKALLRLLGRSQTNQSELETIKLHVEIRNSIQHHSSRVPQGLAKRLGRDIVVVDSDGKRVTLDDGDYISLSAAEIDVLKRAQLVVLSSWRKKYEKDPEQGSA